MNKRNLFALLSITLLFFFITDRADSASASSGSVGAIKCVKTSISSCTVPTIAEYSSDWNVSCDTNVAIKGVGVCASLSGTDEFSEEGVISSNIWYDGSDLNSVCWCKIISPFVSHWTFAGYIYENYTYCQQGCAKTCAQLMKDNSTFRTNIYKTKQA